MIGTNKNSGKKCYCKFCGKEIKWVQGKSVNGKKVKPIPVEPKNTYFIPGFTGMKFVLSNGSTQVGREASDGIIGYYRHICPASPSRKVLSEKEIKSRKYA